LGGSLPRLESSRSSLSWGSFDMGFSSSSCLICNHALIEDSPYSWQREGIVILPNGECWSGRAGMYGDVGGRPIPHDRFEKEFQELLPHVVDQLSLPPALETRLRVLQEKRDFADASVYHVACWEAAGRPGFIGYSKFAISQGIYTNIFDRMPSPLSSPEIARDLFRLMPSAAPIASGIILRYQAVARGFSVTPYPIEDPVRSGRLCLIFDINGVIPSGAPPAPWLGKLGERWIPTETELKAHWDRVKKAEDSVPDLQSRLLYAWPERGVYATGWVDFMQGPPDGGGLPIIQFETRDLRAAIESLVDPKIIPQQGASPTDLAAALMAVVSLLLL